MGREASRLRLRNPCCKRCTPGCSRGILYAPAPASPEASMTNTLLRNCHALVPDERGVLNVARNQDIVVRGNRIAEIRPTGQPPEEGLEVIEAQQMLAMPGLINTHS